MTEQMNKDAEQCPMCGSTGQMCELHGSLTCLNCHQKIEGCCGGG